MEKMTANVCHRRERQMKNTENATGFLDNSSADGLGFSEKQSPNIQHSSTQLVL